MVTIYIKRIRAGLMTLEDVPPKWRTEVEKRLEEDA